MELPPNVFHRLMLVGGAVIAVGGPLPGGGPTDPKVWLIVFTPAKTYSELLTGEEGEDDKGNPVPGEPEGESRWTTPAKYMILMREHDNKLGEDVQVHEVWADKVLMASRLPSQSVAIEEFTTLLREELGDDAKVDLQNLSRPSNGQASTATAAAP